MPQKYLTRWLIIFQPSLVACASPGALTPVRTPASTSVPPTRAAPAATPTQLEGTRWRLELIKGQNLLAGSTITLEFQSGKAKGSSGCNSYEAAYSIPSSTDLTIASELLQTVMACAKPEGVMEQEVGYLHALRSAKRYEIQTRALVLKDTQGLELLRYQVLP